MRKICLNLIFIEINVDDNGDDDYDDDDDDDIRLLKHQAARHTASQLTSHKT